MNNTNKNEIITIIESIALQRMALNSEVDMGIIDTIDATTEIEMLNKKERKLKEQLVLNQHQTEKGVIRSISHHLPTTDNPKEYFITKMPDGKKIKGATYDILIDKLYTYYTDGLSDFSAALIFRAALKEKEVTENPKQNTLDKDLADFNRFITTEFGKRDVRSITDIDIKAYCQQFVTKNHPKKKTFLSLKGTLNMIFNYAKRHKIIMDNPLDNVSNKPYLKSCDTTSAKPEDKILSPAEIDMLKAEVRRRMEMDKYGRYYINGFAMLFAIETGVRVGELCSLKWEDVLEDRIHIHTQQLYNKQPGGKEYYQVQYTKNERGESEDGREFPLTQKIKSLLSEIKSLQYELNINSEFIFCHENGEWIKTDAYETFLRRLCTSLGLKVTNNHALRMSLNSNVLIPLGISVANRAAMLGHSIETNLKFYSFAEKGYLSSVCEILDKESNLMDEAPPSTCLKGAILQDSANKNALREPEGTPGNPSNVIIFEQKKSSRTAYSQAF